MYIQTSEKIYEVLAIRLNWTVYLSYEYDYPQDCITMNGLQVASLFLFISGGAFCYPGQLMDEPSSEHQLRLQVLKLTMVLDKKWAPVWSEKLKPVKILKQPKPSFCMELIPKEKMNEPINTLQVIMTILQNCSFSGMYVSHGLHMLSHSTKCFFQKHALVHLETINLHLNSINDEFKEYLKQLLIDYQLIADKFAVVGSSLKNIIELVSLFNEIVKGIIVEDSKEYDEIKQKYIDLRKLITTEHNKVCAISTNNMWYDPSVKKYLEININQELITGNQQALQEQQAEQSSDTPLKRALLKAEELRISMKRVFDELVITEMSADVWKDIFNNNILLTESDLQKEAQIEALVDVEVEPDVYSFPWAENTEEFIDVEDLPLFD